MLIIIGLGNPGTKFIDTRHNIGFRIIETLADKHNIKINRKKHFSFIGQGVIKGEKAILIKPQTYMNDSGKAVADILNFYKKSNEDIIVIYDDTTLDVGRLRIREKGSAGGHNGVKSIIEHTGTSTFNRIKVGVGERPVGWDLADYVLSRFSSSEEKEVDNIIKRSVEAIEVMLDQGVEVAMNRYNSNIL